MVIFLLLLSGIPVSNYLGCFLDAENRDLPEHISLGDQATVSLCLSQCRNKGFPFAGLQAGADCYCGNDFGRNDSKVPRPDAECLVSCKGDGKELCGGLWRNAVYAVGLRPTLLPAEYECDPQQGLHWMPYSQVCVAITEPVFFKECRSLCAKQHRTFMVPEQSFFFEELTTMSNWMGSLPEDYWINFACEDGNWVTSTSTSSRYVPLTTWTPRRLRGDNWNSANTWETCNPKAGRNCGVAGFWEGKYHPLDANCSAQKLRCLCADARKPEIAQQDATNVGASLHKKKESSCEHGWRHFNNGCYLKVTEKKTFLNAMKFCTAKGAHLVTIDSKEENAFISSLGTSPQWIGLKSEDMKEFRWMATNGIPSYENWGIGEPSGNRNCVWMRSDGHWLATRCDHLYIEFVCKKELS